MLESFRLSLRYQETYCNSKQLHGFSRSQYLAVALIHLSPHQATTLLSLCPSGHSLWNRNMVPCGTRQLARKWVWVRLTSGALCDLYYAFPGRLVLRMRISDQPLTYIIRTTRLKFFDHIARANPSMDHSRALRACVTPLPRDWNHRSGRPRHTWLRTAESDMSPVHTTRVHGPQCPQDVSTGRVHGRHGSKHYRRQPVAKITRQS